MAMGSSTRVVDDAEVVIIGPEMASTALADDGFLDDYKELLASFFPPAVDWFVVPARAGPAVAAHGDEL